MSPFDRAHTTVVVIGRFWITLHSVFGVTFDFLFDSNRNHASISYRFRDIAGYLSKVADFVRDNPGWPVPEDTLTHSHRT